MTNGVFMSFAIYFPVFLTFSKSHGTNPNHNIHPYKLFFS